MPQANKNESVKEQQGYSFLGVTKKTILIIIFTLTIFQAYKFAPPKPHSDRLDKIDQKSVTIDNTYYGEPNFAPTWWKQDSWAQGLHALNPTRTKYILDLFEKLKTPKESQIFDVGCGAGLITKVISSKGYTNVIGMDIQENSIEAAKNNDVLTKYLVGSIYEIPLKDKSVDVIIISDVMAHLFDLRAAYKEINRILKPKGLIIFESITRTLWSYLTIKLLGESFGFIPKNTHDYRMFVSPEDLSRLFKEFNFEMKSYNGIQVTFGFDFPKIYVKDSYLLKEYEVRDTFIGYGFKN
eukprot:gene2054-1560_t